MRIMHKLSCWNEHENKNLNEIIKTRRRATEREAVENDDKKLGECGRDWIWGIETKKRITAEGRRKKYRIKATFANLSDVA